MVVLLLIVYFCKNQAAFHNVCKCVCSEITKEDDILKSERGTFHILSDLDLIVLHLKDIYSTKMHRLYTELVDIKNSKNNLKKTEPFKIWKESSGSGEDSSTHTEVLVIYKILSGINSSGSPDKKLIDLLPSEWTTEDKKEIAKSIPAVLFSRKAMCDTCETFMSCFFSYIFDGSTEPRATYHTVFAYSIGEGSSEHDASSKLLERKYEDRDEPV